MRNHTESSGPKRRPWWQLLLPLVGLGLLVWVISRLDHAAMGAALERVSGSFVLMAALVFGINVIIKAVRWRRLLDGQGITLKWGVAVAGFFAGAFYGAVTVGRVGEFLRVGVLTGRGVPFGKALASCVFDRVLDLVTLASVGGMFGAFILGDWQLAAVVGAGLVVGLPFGWWLVMRGAAWASRDGGRSTFAGIRDLLVASPDLLRGRVLAEAIGWTAVAWIGHFATVWILAAGLGITVSKTLLTAATAFAALSTLLPITYQGVGTRELIFAYALNREAVPKETAVVLALLTITVMLVTTVIMGGLGLWAQRARPDRIHPGSRSGQSA